MIGSTALKTDLEGIEVKIHRGDGKINPSRINQQYQSASVDITTRKNNDGTDYS